MIRNLFFDLDDTLLDFRKSEHDALAETLRAAGIPVTADTACATSSASTSVREAPFRAFCESFAAVAKSFFARAARRLPPSLVMRFVRARAAASSMRSIALSGRFRSLR